MSLENSKRIKTLKKELIKKIPRVPNDRATLQVIEAQHLTDLLIIYIGWRLRHVAPRPRTVTGLDAIASYPHTIGLQPNIDAFIRVVESGEDLTPHLSLLSRVGYAPSANPRTARDDNWSDKDFLLNVMGFHHFHLGLTKETKGHTARTDEVLFASVTRDSFEIVGLFDHAAFKHTPDEAMTPERRRIWAAYEDRQQRGALPGQLIIGGYGGLGITGSGYPLAVVRAAQRHVAIMNEIDPNLDDTTFVRGLYGMSTVPAKPKFRWHYKHLDLCLFDEAAGFLGVLQNGPN